ncbi:MAG: SRPBCC family protein [Pseudolabrys sp.]
MIDTSRFRPGTVYVIYISATPEKVWQALTDSAFTAQYFFGFTVEVEPKVGGVYRLRTPDGKVHVEGEVVEWQPPRRLASTWRVEGMPGFGDLPDCLVSYDIEVSGEAVKLTMMESHSWDISDAILAGGRAGWPAILSSLKSVVETGKAVAMKMEGPPPGMVEAVRKALVEKPWLTESGRRG